MVLLLNKFLILGFNKFWFDIQTDKQNKISTLYIKIIWMDSKMAGFQRSFFKATSFSKIKNRAANGIMSYKLAWDGI